MIWINHYKKKMIIVNLLSFFYGIIYEGDTMKIIIVGIGKLGEYLAKELVKDNNEVTLIDLSFYGKESLINNEDLNYIEGNALDYTVLEEAGIKETDLLISVMEHDEDNLMCSLLSKKLGAKHTIARVRKPEYLSSINIIKDELGLSMTINPELLTAYEIAQTLNIPSALSAKTFLKGRVEVITLKIKEGSVLHKMSINTLSRRLDNNIIVCSIERDGEIIIPHGRDILRAGDIINVTGTRKSIFDFLKFDGLVSEKTKKVMIAGGSAIAIYLTRILLEMGMYVKIIEIDKARCTYLSEILPKALIINGDASNQSVLYEEGIEDCDAFISLTSIDEENIVYSIFASQVNVPKIITKINHINLDGVIEALGINTAIAPHRIAANQVVQYVRAMNNSTNRSSIEAIYKFEDNIEMLQFNVKDDFKGVDIRLADLELKEGILIVAIMRGKNIIFPYGKDVIKKRDVIVLINGLNHSLVNLNDILV